MTGHIPRDPDWEGRVRASFARQGLMAHLGATLVRVAPGTCVISAPVTPHVSQQQGFAHAGLTFAIADSAAGYAALSLMDAGVEVVTAELKINLIAPAKGPLLTATGDVARSGRRLSVVRAEVRDASGTVALVQGTMMPVPGATAD